MKPLSKRLRTVGGERWSCVDGVLVVCCVMSSRPKERRGERVVIKERLGGFVDTTRAKRQKASTDVTLVGRLEAKIRLEAIGGASLNAGWDAA